MWPTFTVEAAGALVTGSRWMKSKIPWPPGSRPVMKFDQATGLWGGMLVPRDCMPSPSAISLRKFGMCSG